MNDEFTNLKATSVRFLENTEFGKEYNEKIEAQLNAAKNPGKTTTLGRVKYNSLVNRLEKMYRGMYPDPDESNIRGTFGPWKPYKRK